MPPQGKQCEVCHFLGHLDGICRLRDGLLLPLQHRQVLQLLVLHASSARHFRRNHFYGTVSGLITYVLSK